MTPIHINGNDLSLQDFAQIVLERRPVILEPAARQAVERARAVVDDLVENDRMAYAITTGVGKLADVRISGKEVRELQINLVRSHAVGVGEPLSETESRAMMLLRAAVLATGRSGARPVCCERLCELLDAGVLTMVRRTRGDDIDAACGQLKGQVLDRTRRQAEFRRKLEQGVRDAA